LWLDIQAGIPLITDATKEEFVPQMANFDQIGGVSFHKGCYPGQEVIARTQYLGKVKRHLYRISATVPIAAGNPVYSPENPEHACGMVANAAPAPEGGYVALAVIQEGFVDAGDLELGAPGGSRLVTQPVTF
jgi:folate-binding protein YgfZ